jgi:hypothetical protein
MSTIDILHDQIMAFFEGRRILRISIAEATAHFRALGYNVENISVVGTLQLHGVVERTDTTADAIYPQDPFAWKIDSDWLAPAVPKGPLISARDLLSAYFKNAKAHSEAVEYFWKEAAAKVFDDVAGYLDQEIPKDELRLAFRGAASAFRSATRECLENTIDHYTRAIEELREA